MIRTREIKVNEYAWWLPRLLILAGTCLLLMKTWENAVEDPYGKGYRIDQGHRDHLNLFYDTGMLTLNEKGKLVANEEKFLSWFEDNYSLGKAYALIRDKRESSDEDVENARLLLSKRGILAAEGLNEEKYRRLVIRYPVGDHFYGAAANLHRFQVKDNKLSWDTFYLRETNTFSVAPLIPRGVVSDRHGEIIAGWDERGRVYPQAPGTRLLVGDRRHFGVERMMDNYLTGKRDLGLHTRLGLRGDDFRGDDVQLSIDAELSRVIYEAFGNKKGAAVVLEVGSGRILAAVSVPEPPAGRLKVGALNLDPNKPLLNRAWDELYFPGSTYKVVVAKGMLSHPGLSDESLGVSTDPNARTRDLERFGRVRNFRGHVSEKPLDLYGAMARSSNTYFGRQGVLLGRRMKAEAELLGFNRAVDLDPGIEETRSWQTVAPIAYEPGVPFSKANAPLIAQFSIGQNQIKSHPLHMATIMQAIANDGEWIEPTLVHAIRKGSRVRKQESHEWKKLPTGKRSQVMPSAHASILRRSMEATMNTYRGTGYRGDQIYLTVAGYQIGTRLREPKGGELIPMAAKTGTAQDGGRKPHAWFVAFGPVTESRYAVAVMVENVGLGGKHAQPIAMEIFCNLLNRDTQVAQLVETVSN